MLYRTASDEKLGVGLGTRLGRCSNSTLSEHSLLYPQVKSVDGAVKTGRRIRRKRARRTVPNRGEVLQMEYHNQVSSIPIAVIFCGRIL